MMLKITIFALAVVAVSAVRENSESQSHYSAKLELAEKYKTEYLEFKGVSPNVLTRASDRKVEAQDVKFYFYGPNNQVEIRSIGDADLPPERLFNASYETKIYVHDWLLFDLNSTNAPLPEIYAARKNKVNYISVDWSKRSGDQYSVIVNETAPGVAYYMSEMMKALVQKQNDVKQIHSMGSGVGAHIAGLAGKLMAPMKQRRITGLSPHGLMYDLLPENKRLARGDADFVDVIHTNFGVYGIGAYIGDANFLPQGGRDQPLAEQYQPKFKNAASHDAAGLYYLESIEFGYAGFIGKKADSWSDFKTKKAAWMPTAIMGEGFALDVTGNIYLSVNATSPYSMGITGAYRA